ncbi:MAG: TIGR04190 family B12-binding domain/radical SAM domain protein [Deltaproteobacteria bacterium]|nr:TIGR04190 family B12-binding domain/radical SAM domain protein [Candidatus Anaeroferrophillus wilburensis]MBN2888402.1 TIGR04190 family B12-binding domain/radical SAM domain protein [Deltaproteobacteria bacterium]
MAVADVIFLHAPTVYDFRRRATLWGPTSDLVPSEPIFDMYPVGFSTMCAYLEEAGFRTRIVNLAARMVRSKTFNVEQHLARLQGRAFGIDLHWLPHAHGSLAIAELVKKYHPETPVFFGGFSASYFYQELIGYPQVDYVLRGDSTEEPLHQLTACITAADHRDHIDEEALAAIPNLSWKDRQGEIHHNPQTYLPADLDHLEMNYRQMVRSVVRDFDFLNYIPFSHWIDYPAMAVITVRGCKHNCSYCGGSASASRLISDRKAPAFRSPEKLAQDMRDMYNISRGPGFILGDIRHAGMDYAHRFLKAIKGYPGQGMLEIFGPIDRPFADELADALPNFVVEFSPESHDPAVRRALNMSYTNEEIEDTIANCLAVGCRRFDLFFMIGLPEQTAQSVLESIDYFERLLERYGDGRFMPFIGPLAPFVDPGSLLFEQPEKYGYHILCRTLEEHRQILLAPTWKHILNYETHWMSRDEMGDVTYEAGRRLNALKAKFGLISPAVAAETDDRINRAVALMARIDRLLNECSPEELKQELLALKPQIDRANASTVCEKTELDLPYGITSFNLPQLIKMGTADICSNILKRRRR